MNERRRLARLGLAPTLLARCPKCDMLIDGVYHKDVCSHRDNTQRPLLALEQPRQPWEPRPARRAA